MKIAFLFMLIVTGISTAQASISGFVCDDGGRNWYLIACDEESFANKMAFVYDRVPHLTMIGTAPLERSLNAETCDFASPTMRLSFSYVTMTATAVFKGQTVPLTLNCRENVGGH